MQYYDLLIYLNIAMWQNMNVQEMSRDELLTAIYSLIAHHQSLLDTIDTPLRHFSAQLAQLNSKYQAEK